MKARKPITPLERTRRALAELEAAMKELRAEVDATAAQHTVNAAGGRVRVIPAQRLGRAVPRSVFDLASVLPANPTT